MYNTLMNRKLALCLFILAFIAGSVWLFSLRAPQAEVGNGKIHIVASFFPLAHVASIVGADLVSVRTLVPAGIEPHDFEPSSRDFIEIGKANLLLYNGAGLEPWVKKWQASGFAGNVHAIDMALALREQGTSLADRNGTIDPHFWLDPMIYQKEAEIVRDTLIALDPQHQDMFRENATRFISKLSALGEHFQKGLASCDLHDIIISHDAFEYLASRYGFIATAIAGISPDEEPAPKDLVRIATIARDKKVKFIFSETIANPKFSELIAREIGVATLVLNPIESLTPDEVQLQEDYISIMEKNLINLRKAMSCN